MFSQCNLWIPVIAAVLAFGAGGPATIFGQDATASGRAPAVKTQRAVPANRQTVRATTGISGTSGNAKPRPPVMGPEFPVLQAKHAGGGNVMTLEQAYDRTILSDQTIITAYIEIQKANLTALGTLTTLGPSVTGSLGKGTSGTSTRFPDQNYTTHSHSDSGTASISYRQTLIDFTVLPAWRQGKLGIQESRLTYQYTVRSVLYDLSDVYYRVLKQRRILAVYRESLRLAEGQLDIAQKKAAAGEVLRSDVLNAKVTVEGNRQLTIEAENALESLKSTLRNILSLPVNAPIEVVEPPEHARTVASIDRLLMQAMVQREDLRAKALFVDQTMEGRKKALAQYAPTVTAQADAAYGDYSGNSRSRQGTWNANIAVDIPIFTGGQRELDVANSRNLIDQARLDYDDRAKNIQQEVKDAWLNVRTIEAYLRSLQVQVEAADQAYLDIQNQYKAGTSTSIEVLASLNSLNVVRRDLAAKSYDYEIALRKIDEVIGVFQEERVQKLNMK